MVKISAELQTHTLFLFFLLVDKSLIKHAVSWVMVLDFHFGGGKGEVEAFFSSSTYSILKYFPLSTSSEDILSTKAFTRVLHPESKSSATANYLSPGVKGIIQMILFPSCFSPAIYIIHSLLLPLPSFLKWQTNK